MEKKDGKSWELPEEEYKKLISRDPVAWQEFIRLNYNLLIGYIIKKFSCSKDDAQDIVQDSLLEALTNLHNLKNPAKLNPWLFTIVRRIAYKKLIVKSRPHLMPLGDHDIDATGFEPGENIDPQELQFERRIWISKHLNVLTSGQIPIFVLRFYDHLSNTTIANSLDKSVNDVNAQLAKAIKTLRQAFEKEFS